ncbi:MAG: putative metal-dependent protease of the PAD1/JAB1 superfamily [Phormidesmis priestleyi Ana]|uniref:Putative metal-dependent protease of the PAD1/JAB1 superfamily n=1 Tax=Phormidesmis priestleyi Ana TaxID=1666911 RepID=A0A0P7YZ42_9CYAN|nr:MAG: putative metal-dependent protease of the PAD1/JAB1 superfamily [Phormidesmis priestleyi Ana]
MVLALTSQHLADMSAHAERVYPEECCGLLLGNLTSHATARSEADEPIVEKVLSKTVALENHWTTEMSLTAVPATLASASATLAPATLSPGSDPNPYTKRRRYAINPEDMLRVQKQARDQGLNIIGIYHSHPDHEAVPSECDRLQAWPDYAYVIVSVQGNIDHPNTEQRNKVRVRAVDVQNWTLDLNHQFQPEAMKVAPSAARDRMPASA